MGGLGMFGMENVHFSYRCFEEKKPVLWGLFQPILPAFWIQAPKLVNPHTTKPQSKSLSFNNLYNNKIRRPNIVKIKIEPF